MDEINMQGNSGTATETRAERAGRRTLEETYERAREYGDKSLEYVGQMGLSLTEFARREPYLALAGAFLVGYVAAKILRRLSD